jgi:hypothetical protein
LDYAQKHSYFYQNYHFIKRSRYIFVLARSHTPEILVDGGRERIPVTQLNVKDTINEVIKKRIAVKEIDSLS